MEINILRQFRRQFLPRLAEVAGPVKIGPHVIHAMGIDDDISRRWIKMRGLDAVHRSPRRHARNILGNVGPILAAILRYLYQAVVAAGPEDSLLFR